MDRLGSAAVAVVAATAGAPMYPPAPVVANEGAARAARAIRDHIEKGGEGRLRVGSKREKVMSESDSEEKSVSSDAR